VNNKIHEYITILTIKNKLTDSLWHYQP
jgi:hypothetical protein